MQRSSSLPRSPAIQRQPRIDDAATTTTTATATATATVTTTAITNRPSPGSPPPTPIPANGERDGDETPVVFNEEDDVEMPTEGRKPAISATSTAATDPKKSASQQPADTSSNLLNLRLFKGNEGFGFSVQSGVDRTGVSIKGVKEGGVAEQAGMQIGDELVEVDGRDLRSLTRDQVIEVLQAVPKLTVSSCSTLC